MSRGRKGYFLIVVPLLLLAVAAVWWYRGLLQSVMP